MFQAKPVDWLLANYLFVRVCLDNMEAKYCPKAMEKAIRKYKPSLFQHMGVESSLKGKVQKLRVKSRCLGLLIFTFFLYLDFSNQSFLIIFQEKDFGKIELFIPHVNPAAKKVWTTLKVYQSHTLEDAYSGKSFFWWGHFPSMDGAHRISYHPYCSAFICLPNPLHHTWLIQFLVVLVLFQGAQSTTW